VIDTSTKTMVFSLHVKYKKLRKLACPDFIAII
jgi:hypothetical protein